MTLQKSDFYFELPEDQVAHQPLEDRSLARLLISKGSEFIDDHVTNLGKWLPPGALIIRNNSRVIPSRIIGSTIHGGKVELMLLEPVSNTTACIWKALGKPMKKLREGSKIQFNGIEAAILSTHSGDTPYVTVEFALSWDQFYHFVDHDGFVPLPPYIKRAQPLPASLSQDTERYQTVYAGPKGSVAAPTAGLHFTQQLIERMLYDYQIKMADVTLHVGAGTFLPVKSDQISHHQMHSERYYIPNDTWKMICSAKSEGRPIFAVGTTSFRSVESFLRLQELKDLGAYTDRWLDTDLFIYPKNKADRYYSQIFDGLMTNFHQPESTLLMLISALLGYEYTLKLYQHAIQAKYRFYSYGDSSLLYFS